MDGYFYIFHEYDGGGVAIFTCERNMELFRRDYLRDCVEKDADPNYTVHRIHADDANLSFMDWAAMCEDGDTPELMYEEPI